MPGTWNRDNVIVFSSTATSSLSSVSAKGGTPTPVTTLDTGAGETRHVYPFFLPDGRHFLYLATSGNVPHGVYVGSLDSMAQKRLLPGVSNAQYAQGHLVFLQNAALMAQPFDAKRLELTGDAVLLDEQILTDPITGTGIFAVADTDVLIYQLKSLGLSQLVWLDRSGKQTDVLGAQARYWDLQLSPDGEQAAVGLLDPVRGTPDLWVYDIAHKGPRTRLTFDLADTRASIWSPDGRRVVFNSNRKGHLDLYQKASSGAGTEDVLLADEMEKYPLSWSPDGRFILYEAGGAPGAGAAPATGHLWVLPLSGDRKPFPFLKSQFNEDFGQFSPDGRWIAYQSNEPESSRVYVAPFPGPGGKWQISTSGGVRPRWSHDGKEIFYFVPDKENTLMAAAVNGEGATLKVSAIRPLFKAHLRGARHVYDVSADGQRFLVNTDAEQTSPPAMTLVLNWTATLKK